jgi:integrase
VRQGARSGSIRVHFLFRGREMPPKTLKGLAPTKANLLYARNLKGEIDNAIARGTFDYAKSFPNSKRARQLTGSIAVAPTIGQLLDAYFAALREAVRKGKLLPFYPGWLRANQKIPLRLLDRCAGETRSRPKQSAIGVATFDCTRKTISDILGPLKMVLDDAVTDGLIEKNPIDKRALKRTIERVAKKSEYVVDPFDAKEMAAILSTAPIRCRTCFALHSGAASHLGAGGVAVVERRLCARVVRVREAVVVREQAKKDQDRGRHPRSDCSCRKHWLRCRRKRPTPSYRASSIPRPAYGAAWLGDQADS